MDKLKSQLDVIKITGDDAEIFIQGQITNDIKNSLDNIVQTKKYKFIWYENPKMNIKDIYHVQVFWIKE